MKLSELLQPKRKIPSNAHSCKHSEEIQKLKIQLAQTKEQMHNVPVSTFITPYVFEEIDYFGGGTPSFFSVRKQNAKTI